MALLPEFQKYKTWILDCDGVLLQTNELKTEIFRQVTLPYGQAASDAMVEYHQRLAGVGRAPKLEYFLSTILGKTSFEAEKKELLEQFSSLLRDQWLDCPEAPRLRDFLEALSALPGNRSFIVSGAPTNELLEVFQLKGLSKELDGIHGTPRSKAEILTELFSGGTPPRGQGIYLGDARYDYEMARQFDLDFVFCSRYTEFFGWKKFFGSLPLDEKSRVKEVADLSELLD